MYVLCLSGAGTGESSPQSSRSPRKVKIGKGARRAPRWAKASAQAVAVGDSRPARRMSSQKAGKLEMRKRHKARRRGRLEHYELGARFKAKALSMSAIQRHWTERPGRFSTATSAMMKSSKGLSGKLKLRWTIRPNGRVFGVKQIDNRVSPVVGKCVLKVVRRLKFSRPKGGMVVVTCPWIFSQQ